MADTGRRGGDEMKMARSHTFSSEADDGKGFKRGVSYKRGLSPSRTFGTSPSSLMALQLERISKNIMLYADTSDIQSLLQVCREWKRIFSPFKFYHYAEKVVSTLENGQTEQKCLNCWLLKKFCVCKSLEEIKARVELRNYQVILFIHYKELGQKLASNTARLLPLLLDADVYTFGDLASECTMFERINSIKRKGELCAVLFPGTNALKPDEFLSKPPNASGNSSDNLCSPESNHLNIKSRQLADPVNIIVIDGSWRNASKYL